MREVITIFIIQSITSVVLFLFFHQFYKAYHKAFLNYWSLSWLFLLIYLIGAILVLGNVQLFKPDHPLVMSFTWMSQLGIYLHVVFLYAGTQQFLLGREFSKKRLKILIILAFILATTFTLTVYHDPEGAQVRYFLRVGIKSLLTGIVFFILGVKSYPGIIYKNPGKSLFSFSLLIYGIDQMVYFIMVLMGLLGFNLINIFNVLGTFDVALQWMIGFGMVIWLLDHERQQLSKVNEELDTFVYRISHDLKAPLSSIMGLLNITKITSDESEKNLCLDMMEKRVHRMDESIKNILNYSRNSRVEVQHDDIDLKEMIRKIFSDLKFLPGAHKIDLQIENGEIHTIKSDPIRMQLILMNLISNAIKYHDMEKPEPYIKIKWRKDGNWIKMVIEDNGLGIEEEYRDRIFSMFFRASVKAEGTGLGLYLVKEAVVKLEGKIEMESHFGIGTRFLIDLPQN